MVPVATSVADPGFPVGGGVDLVRGAMDPRGGYVSKILHVKMKESGPVGGGARRARPPLDPPMYMVPVAPWYLWLHGSCDSMVPMAPWFLWLHGICPHELSLTVKYLLSSLITMPIHNNNYNSIFPSFINHLFFYLHV